MKKLLSSLLTLALIASLGLAAIAQEIEFSTDKMNDKEVIIEDVVSTWINKYEKSSDWKDIPAFENETLPKEVLLRLVVTYYLDEFPGLSLKQLANDFEPRVEVKQVEDNIIWEYRSMTTEGDIFFAINAKTGELTEKIASNEGNG